MHINKYQYISSNINTYQQIYSVINKYQHISTNIFKYEQIRMHISKYQQIKRYVVLKRDNWLCLYCGEKATQVHHKRYAKKNIGREPIKWLQSVCKKCHNKLHN